MDECTEGLRTCDLQSFCRNTEGSSTCDGDYCISFFYLGPEIRNEVIKPRLWGLTFFTNIIILLLTNILKLYSDWCIFKLLINEAALVTLKLGSIFVKFIESHCLTSAFHICTLQLSIG